MIIMGYNVAGYGVRYRSIYTSVIIKIYIDTIFHLRTSLESTDRVFVSRFLLDRFVHAWLKSKINNSYSFPGGMETSAGKMSHRRKGHANWRLTHRLCQIVRCVLRGRGRGSRRRGCEWSPRWWWCGCLGWCLRQ